MIETRFKAVRKHLKMTQEELAKAVNSKRTTITGYEKGVSLPHPEVLAILNSKFNISSDWVLTGNGKMIVENLTLKGETIKIEKSIIEQEIEKMVEEVTEKMIEKKTAEKLKAHEERFTKVEENLEEIKKVIRKVTVRTMGSDGTVYESIEEYAEDGELLNKKPIKSSNPLYPGVVPADDVFGVEEPTVPYGKEIDLPLIEHLAAGIPIESTNYYETFPVSKTLIKGKKEDYCVAKICGTSMSEAGIPDGSFVLLKHCTTAENGAVSVVQYEDKTTLKLLHQDTDGSWELKYCDKSGAIIRLKDGTWEVKARYITTLKKNH